MVLDGVNGYIYANDLWMSALYQQRQICLENCIIMGIYGEVDVFGSYEWSYKVST
jgi:hypothetical protein